MNEQQKTYFMKTFNYKKNFWFAKFNVRSFGKYDYNVGQEGTHNGAHWKNDRFRKLIDRSFFLEKTIEHGRAIRHCTRKTFHDCKRGVPWSKQEKTLYCNSFWKKKCFEKFAHSVTLLTGYIIKQYLCLVKITKFSWPWSKWLDIRTSVYSLKLTCLQTHYPRFMLSFFRFEKHDNLQFSLALPFSRRMR